jgi:signal transduction histidine kinase
MMQEKIRAHSVFITLGIIIVLSVFAVMSLQTLYTYNTTKTRLVAKMHQSAEHSAAALKENIAGLIQAYALNEYDNLVLTEMQHSDSFAIIIRDFNMGRITGKEAYVSGKIRIRDAIVEYDSANDDHNRRLEACSFAKSYPIETATKEPLGTISVYMSGDAMERELQTIIAATALNTLTIALLLVITLFATIHRFILRPLSQIVTAIDEKDADGIPVRDIPCSGPKEIRTLARTLRMMIEAVKHSRTQMQDFNTRLHQKVEEGVQANTRLEKEKLEQEKLLIEQSKMAAMGEMISAIAHQWRQPLSALSLDIQDLLDAKQYGELDEQYLKKMVERSANTIRYMSRTIDDFRNFFLPNKEKEPFGIYEAIEATKTMLGKQFEAHQIVIESRGEDFLVDGFKSEFQQVLINLLNNAKDAIIKKQKESGSFQGHVTIAYTDNKITVSDNGGGIPETIMERIFEPYFSTKFSSQGTGIGLYMSKTIIERNMQGTIRAYNEGEGAAFEIVLPKENPAGPIPA